MYAATSPCDLPAIADGAAPPRLERARGCLGLGFHCDAGGRDRLFRCFQQGSLKARFPRTEANIPEAVMLNTAGGMTGGDAFSVEAEIAQGARATLTTQAAERIYRSKGADACLRVSLTLGQGSRLDWLPQETILFDGGRLFRRLDVAMAGDARLLLCEAVVMGRVAHGETVRGGRLADHWRIRRDGRLVYADSLGIGGDVAAIGKGRATLDGNGAFATLLAVSPDAEGRLAAVRGALDGSPTVSGASAWDGMLAARILAQDGARLRAALLGVLAALDIETPRVWSI